MIPMSMRTNKSAIPFAVFFLILSACASKPLMTPAKAERRRPIVNRPTMTTDTGMGDSVAEDSPYSSPAQVQTTGASNPAAESLVAKGIEEVQANNLESAEWSFEEAIRLAPQYGPAYYWMAVVKYTSKELSQAKSFLDKAQSLAPPDSNWQNRIQSLRNDILAGEKY